MTGWEIAYLLLGLWIGITAGSFVYAYLMTYRDADKKGFLYRLEKVEQTIERWTGE